MSSNGSTTYKLKRITFFNKPMVTLLSSAALIVLIPCSYIMLAYWSDMPLPIKLFVPIVFIIVFVGIIMVPLNGMLITKRGTVLFVPDLRLKKFNLKDLKRISIVFNEWENNKYSATVKFVCTDGTVFLKDYSKQFANMKKQKLARSAYTLSKRKVDKICYNLSDMDVCIITIIDKNHNIVNQTMPQF